MTTVDPWAAWLLERRHGGDERSLAETLEFLAPIRDRVLDNARIGPGDTLLDVGCGDGLVAFGALKRGASVVFSDISQELLDVCREIAAGDERCTFVKAAATDLSAVPDASVDAVTMRSVLIYVADRERAFAEFRRVLKPGGRLSIFEPLNSFEYPGPDDWWGAWDIGEVRELADRVKGVFRAIHDREGNTMHDFVATDFVELAEQAGFGESTPTRATSCRLRPGPSRPGRPYENSSGNPLVPTLREAADSVLAPEESERFRGHLRRQAESGEGIERGATLYLWAVRGSLTSRMAKQVEQVHDVVIRFAGDSGDGMQLTGGRFTSETAALGNDLSTFPDFPAEIRAPAGSLPGVSGFQIHFSDHDILTPATVPTCSSR